MLIAGEHFTISDLRTTSATNLHTPGEFGQFPNGVVARYGRAAATLDNSTFAEGEPALFVPSTSWDYIDTAETVYGCAYLPHLVTNVYNATGASLYVAFGFAAVAIPVNYWGWFVVFGYHPHIRTYDTGIDAYELCSIVDASTNGGLSVAVTATAAQIKTVYPLEGDDATNHWVGGLIDINGWGTFAAS